jgi:hypothetical protein
MGNILIKKIIYKNYPSIELIMSIFCIALLTLSPFLTLFISGLILINVNVLSKNTRILLSIIMIVSLAMISGARPILDGDQNDISGYYEIYKFLAAGDLQYLTHFGGGINEGGGIEIGLPILLYIFTFFSKNLSINGLMFNLSLLGSIFVAVWIHKTFYKTECTPSPALIGFGILFLNLYFATQLSRQFFSLIFLLYAITEKRFIWRYVWLLVASSFHITAIPFYIFYKIFISGYTGFLFLVLILILFRLFFFSSLDLIPVFPSLITEKLAYYKTAEQGVSMADLESFKIIFLMIAMSLIVLVTMRFHPAGHQKKWLLIPWIAALIHLILLPIPLASLRTTLMFTAILPGIIIYMMFQGGGLTMKIIRIFSLNFFLIYKAIRFLTPEGVENIFYTVNILEIL